ncbi:hypothetical protein PFISCL1PPCAC_10032 [Pristionchus fissidentatus]|uniref:RING-type domain-containing protein n=1 Tax=Pristionchus fissidentatus TaxID=1538716 RepID=A0AAV5VLA3_9BILA|nr:hypothetical protein PFISCL1PPCAC_10032 [Pristionchus fissidentatus]
MAESPKPLCYSACSQSDRMCSNCSCFVMIRARREELEEFLDGVELEKEGPSREQSNVIKLTPREEGVESEEETDSEEDTEYEVYSEEDEETEWNRERRKRIQKEREEDHDPSSLSIRYSRRCGICLFDNPRVRAVFTDCGHSSCIHCANQLVDEDDQNPEIVECPFCREFTSFVRLFESVEEFPPSSPLPLVLFPSTHLTPLEICRRLFRYVTNFLHTVNPLAILWRR